MSTDVEVLNQANPSLAQARLGTKLNQIITLVNEARDDHATFKTAADETETLIEELHDDHATFKTAADETETLIEELHDDHATFKTVVDDIKTLLNNCRTWALNHVLGNPGLAINSNFDVKNGNAYDYVLAGTLYTDAVDGNCDTGTAATFPQGTWGIMLVSVNSSGALTGTWDTNTGSGHANEAAAIAVLPATPANEVSIGYVTVQAAAGASFTAGTDALQGGTGGTPAQTTSYYNIDNGGVLTAAVSSSSPGALSASKPASAPATLTATKPASAPAAISASAVDVLTA